MLKSMGVSTNTGWKGYQAQHIIPAEFKNHPLIQKIGMNFDDASNGIFLPIPNTNVRGLSTGGITLHIIHLLKLSLMQSILINHQLLFNNK
ncbi:TPA: AHH domain-containing protein [Streptococcus suis]|nr:AHH domain-containing protein [Streptococcus suis]